LAARASCVSTGEHVMSSQQLWNCISDHCPLSYPENGGVTYRGGERKLYDTGKRGRLWALAHWANTQLINFLGTSKYIQTIGKTCSAPQTTLIQKAHYQHKSQFPYCARRVGRVLFRPAEPERQSGFLLPPWIQPTRLPPGKSPKPLPGRHCQIATTVRQEKSTPDFSRHQEPGRFGDLPPPVILSSNPDLRSPWATALLAREVPLEPMMEMSGRASQRSSMTGLSSKPRTHRIHNRCRRCENLTKTAWIQQYFAGHKTFLQNDFDCLWSYDMTLCFDCVIEDLRTLEPKSA